MNYFTDFCCLCLQQHDKLESIMLQDSCAIKEKLKFVLPEEVSNQVECFNNICITCSENINSIYNFKCYYIENISTLNGYIQNLTDFDDSSDYLSIKLADVVKYKNKLMFDSNISEPNKVECVVIKVEKPDEDEICAEAEQYAPDNTEKDSYFVVNKPKSKSASKKQYPDYRQYECPECGRMFKNKYHLTDHIRIHTKERPFECPICQKSFTKGSNLNRHKKIHEKNKTFKCTVCEETFPQNYFEIHVKTHTGTKPYSCKVCFRAFAQIGTLRTHERKHCTNKSTLNTAE